MITFIIYLLSFMALLGVLVTIHEYGHFIVARLCKVHVQRFSLGMGPVMYTKLDKHGTEFALSLLPLGGYVSMITNKLIEVEPEIKETLTDEQLKNTFDSKPKWQRASIMFAGPLANFLLSIFIFSIIFLNTPDPQAVTVVKDQSSSIIFKNDGQSIVAGDEIKSINSVEINDPKDINLELLSYAGYSGYIDLGLKRNGIDSQLNVSIQVTDYLPTSESQSNPLGYLGLTVENKMLPIVGQIVSGGAAESAGLKPNDIIRKIDNQKIQYASDLRAAVSMIPNSTALFNIEREGELIQLPVKIQSQLDNEGKEYGAIGIAFGTSRSLSQAVSKGIFETYNLSKKTLQFIGKMLTGNMGTENLSGPIGIAEMAGNTAQAGLLPFLYLMALLSISLAVLNLLPIPVLDGGQLTLLGLEALRGKPLSEKVENYIYSGGAILVGMLMIFAVFNDVSRFF
jgi:regulator of sigma E protease